MLPNSAPTSPGQGGFGSDDPSDWIWGLRHGVRFDSLLDSIPKFDKKLLAGLARRLRQEDLKTVQ